LKFAQAQLDEREEKYVANKTTVKQHQRLNTQVLYDFDD